MEQLAKRADFGRAERRRASSCRRRHRGGGRCPRRRRHQQPPRLHEPSRPGARARGEARHDRSASRFLPSLKAFRRTVRERRCRSTTPRAARATSRGSSAACGSVRRRSGWCAASRRSARARSTTSSTSPTSCSGRCGQPLHAFDLATVPGGEIRVRRARAGEKLTTLDGKERELDPEVLVIADRARAIATRRHHGRSRHRGDEAHHRRAARERALRPPPHPDRGEAASACTPTPRTASSAAPTPRSATRPSRRCAALIAEVAGGDGRGTRRRRRRDDVPSRSRWRLSGPELERFAGTTVAGRRRSNASSPDSASRRASAGERLWEGTVPSWRAVDFEPAARDRLPAARGLRARTSTKRCCGRHGLDTIPATLPALGGVDAGENAEHDRRDRLRDRLAGCGYAEAIHYAFHERRADSAFPRWCGDGEPLALANPLSERYAVMRRSLVPNLVGGGGVQRQPRGARRPALRDRASLPGRRGERDRGGRHGHRQAATADPGTAAPRATCLGPQGGHRQPCSPTSGSRRRSRPAELPGVVAGHRRRLLDAERRGRRLVRPAARRSTAPSRSSPPSFVLDRLPLAASDRIRSSRRRASPGSPPI